MTSLERSAALRRLGIAEWLPRQDDVAVIPEIAVSAPAAAAVATVVAPIRASVATNAEQGQGAPLGVRSPPTIPPQIPAEKSAPLPAVQPTSAPANAPSVVPVSSNVPAPGLRGRLLSAAKDAPLLVLAMAEKSVQDNLLSVDTAAGALLKAMLNELAVPASVALLGVGGADPITVPPSILVLGERSARLLLGNDVAMPLRGRVHLFGQARVVVSYHPEELRQNGSLKRLAWDDLRLLAGLLAQAPAASTGRS